MGNTVHYKREHKSYEGKIPIVLIFALIMSLLFCNFIIFKPYTEEVVCTLIDVDKPPSPPSNFYERVGKSKYYWCHYQYEYNGCTYEFYCQQTLYSEAGEQRLVLINPSNPSKYVFSSEVVSWKNVLLPLSTNKYKDGTYTEFAMYLQDKYEYDWELNK